MARVPGTVAHATNGEDHLRVFRILLHFGAQALDVDVDEAGVRGMAVAPHLFEQFLASKDLEGLASEDRQEIEFQWGQVQGLASAANFVCLEVDGKIRDL